MALKANGQNTVNHLWPHSNAMQKKCSGCQSEHLVLVLVLYDAILVMSANSTESNLLVLTNDLVKKTFMSECTVIGVICLRHDFFESLDT